jgi:hypothetical protein
VRIRWTNADGREGVGTTSVSANVSRGTELVVWTTADGRLVGATLTSSQIVTAAVLSALALQAAVTGFAYAAFRGIRRALDRRRYHAWDAEWLYITQHG